MNPQRAAHVIDMLRGKRLWIPETDYPGHGEWLERAEAELVANTKRAMAMYDGGTPMGVVIYQQDKLDPKRLELKNISVNPEVRNRLVGSYLLRNVEHEAAMNDFPDIQRFGVDTKTSNPEMIGFLVSQGYSEVDRADLYDTGMVDAVLEKKVNQL